MRRYVWLTAPLTSTYTNQFPLCSNRFERSGRAQEWAWGEQKAGRHWWRMGKGWRTKGIACTNSVGNNSGIWLVSSQSKNLTYIHNQTFATRQDQNAHCSVRGMVQIFCTGNVERSFAKLACEQAHVGVQACAASAKSRRLDFRIERPSCERHIDLKPEQTCHSSLVIPSPCSSIFTLTQFRSLRVLFLWRCRLVRWKHLCLGRQPDYNFFFEEIHDRYGSVCA